MRTPAFATGQPWGKTLAEWGTRDRCTAFSEPQPLLHSVGREYMSTTCVNTPAWCPASDIKFRGSLERMTAFDEFL